MTLSYCDFCGKRLTEDDPGDPVTLGNPESFSDALKDACEKCFAVLLKMVRPKETDVPVPGLINQELLAVLKDLRDAVKAEPAMNHMRYDMLGARVNEAIAKAEGH